MALMMEKNMIADNQQETDLGWLTGFWDTDGSVTLTTFQQNITPTVAFANTNAQIIENIARIIRDLGVGRHVTWRNDNRSSSTKRIGYVNITGQKRVGALLKKVFPIVKSGDAEIVNEYIEYRASLGHGASRNQIDYQYVTKAKQHLPQAPQRLYAMLSEKSDAFLLSWLAGVVDGDGSIMIREHPIKTNNTVGLHPDVVIINTSPNMIDAVQYVYKRLGFSANVVRKDNGSKATRWVYHIESQSYKRVIPILEAISPHLVGKRKQAEIALELKRYRSTLPYRTGYGDYEYGLKRQMQSLNFRGTGDDDIVRPA